MIDLEEKTATKTEPIKGGWWQNAYVIHTSVNSRPYCGWKKMDDGRWLYEDRFPTRDIAETNKLSPMDGLCDCFVLNHFYGGNYFIWDEAIHFKGDA